MRPVSTTPMQHDTWHRTPWTQHQPTIGQVPPRSSKKCRMHEHKLPLVPKGKQLMNKSRNEKDLATPSAHEEQEDSETRNLLLPYIPPRRTNAAPVSLPTKGHATLVAPKKPKGMKVLQDIFPPLVKLSFQDSDTNKLSALDRKNYMKLVRDTPESLNWFVPMQWENRWE